MQLHKSNNDNVILINLVNMIELRSVISSVAHLVKLMKWDQIDSKILTKYNFMKSYKMIVSFDLNLYIDIIIALYRNFMIVNSEKIIWLNEMKIEKSDNFIENMNYWIWIQNDKIL